MLDALIIDLQNRRVTRADDLWLDNEDGQLRLAALAADPGAGTHYQLCYNILGWGTLILITAAVVTMLGSQIVAMMG